MRARRARKQFIYLHPTVLVERQTDGLRSMAQRATQKFRETNELRFHGLARIIKHFEDMPIFFATIIHGAKPFGS